MECSELRAQIDAWLDGESEPELAKEIESHVSGCPACQALIQQYRNVDTELHALFAADRLAAQTVATRVLRQLPERNLASAAENSNAERSTAAVRPNSPVASWYHLFWAAAAGFLLAVWIFAPQATTPPRPVIATQAAAPMAQLTATTGRVQLFDPAERQWREISPLESFKCPQDSLVRTSPNVRCEIETENGCVLRLNDESEVSLVDARIIEVRRGQVWCRAPEQVAIEVRVLPPQLSVPSSDDISNRADAIRCDVGPFGKLTCRQLDDSIELLNASGTVSVNARGGPRQLAPGEAAQCADGQFLDGGTPIDPILSTRWIHPLLIQKGADDAELHERVNELLAQIGDRKISLLYEQEIRALGAHAAWPLVRLVRSSLSADDPQRRWFAMRLAVDLAPVWLIPEFIELLADQQPEVRVLAAKALERLSGLNMGLPPEQWRAESIQTTTAQERWQEWWRENQQQFPTPALRLGVAAD